MDFLRRIPLQERRQTEKVMCILVEGKPLGKQFGVGVFYRGLNAFEMFIS